MIHISILSISDRASRGERRDLSGEALQQFIEKQGYPVFQYRLISDDPSEIRHALIEMSHAGSDLILTSGGTGLSSRDNTPQVTEALCERLVPTIPQAILFHSLSITPRAMLSRAAAGFYGKTLIVNLPGNPKAVGEIMDFLFESLLHGLDIFNDRTDG